MKILAILLLIQAMPMMAQTKNVPAPVADNIGVFTYGSGPCRWSFQYDAENKECYISITFTTDKNPVTCTPVTPLKDGEQSMKCSYKPTESKP